MTDDANTAVTEIRATILSNTGTRRRLQTLGSTAHWGQIGTARRERRITSPTVASLVSWADDNHNLDRGAAVRRAWQQDRRSGDSGRMESITRDAAMLPDGRIAFAIDDFDATPAPGDEDVNTSIWDHAYAGAHNFDGISPERFSGSTTTAWPRCWLLHDTSVAFNGAVGPNHRPELASDR